MQHSPRKKSSSLHDHDGMQTLICHNCKVDEYSAMKIVQFSVSVLLFGLDLDISNLQVENAMNRKG